MTDLQRRAKEAAYTLYHLGDATINGLQKAIDLVKRIERGELVEVPRCFDCFCKNTEFCELKNGEECPLDGRKPDEHR